MRGIRMTDSKQSATPSWRKLDGTILQGYRVASGMTNTSPYPQGTLEMQLPHFLERGMDLRPYFRGTLNVLIAPHQFRLVKPEITLLQVPWTDAHGPETFSFSRCQLTWCDVTYEGWVYYPHPETKPMHFQEPDRLEILMPKIEGIRYGDRVQLAVLADEIAID